MLRRLTKGTLFCLRFRPLSFAHGAIGEILKTGVPSAEQGAVFCFANLFVQASVNTFGATAIAGSTIALNLEYFTYYCNHRLHPPKPCGRATRAPQKKSYGSAFGPIVLFRGAFCRLFTSDPLVVQSACVRILCILFF